MRNLYIPIIISAFVGLASCGEEPATDLQAVIDSGDVESIRAMKEDLENQQSELAAQVALLDAAISANTENTNIPLVTVVEVVSQEFKHFVELQGTISTDQNLLIYPEVAGTIINMHVREGQQVSKGQLLATIDNGGLDSQLAQMKTQLDLAKTTYERQERLWEQNIGSEIQYLQAKTNYESQKNMVDQLENQLGKFSLRAPFSGIIDDIIKEEGTVVAPGGPGSEVFRIINLSSMYVEVLAPETYLPSIVTGKEAQVFFPVLGETVVSEVKETGNYIDPNNRSYRVKIPVPNSSEKIKPNLTARVKINDYTSADAVLIPQSVISENASGDQYVYVVKESESDVTEVNRRIIETGLSQDGLVEVTSGLSAGMSVVVEGARSVRDGQDVKVLAN